MAANSRVEFSVWELMFAGSNLAELSNVSAGTSIAPTQRRSIGILDRLFLLRSDLESLELTQSEATLLDELEDLIQFIEDPERPSRRLGKDAVRIRNLARRIETTLQAEASSRTTFVVQRSRGGEVESLLRDPVAYLGIPADAPLTITAQASDDFQEAARCYAAGFTAASIMFMWRATEEVVRSYYQQVTQQRASGAWGNLNTTLKIPVLRCPSPLITQLEELASKRNKTMHPNVRLPTDWNEEAAKQVLKECQQAITMMVEDLKIRHDDRAVNEKSA